MDAARLKRPGLTPRVHRALEHTPRAVVLVGVAAIAIVLLVAFARLIVGAADAGRASLEERAAQRTVISAHFIESYNDDLISSIEAHATAALAGEEVVPTEFDQVNAMLRSQAAVLLDDEGETLQTFPADAELVGVDLAKRYDHLRRAVDGEPAITSVIPSAVEGEPIVAFAVPYDSPAGRRVFSAGYRAEDTPLGDYLLNATVLPGEDLFLVDDAGMVIASSEPDAPAALADRDQALVDALATGDRGPYEGREGDRYFVAMDIDGAPWRLVRSLPADAMYAPAEEGGWIPWLIFGAFVAVGAASLLMLSAIIGQRDREHRRARRDPLTGVANRRSLDAAVADQRGVGLVWSVLMVDVDHFKAVNDAHGHQRGDEVLAAVASLIERSVRADDLVGRWGGEEFMVVVPGARLVEATELAERIRAAVEAESVGDVSVTVSIGVASSERTPDDGLVDLADASLYRAKQTGRNRWVALEPEDAFPAMAAAAADDRA
jgi:diguanylate cyclase (GGDEF)-like protein